MTFQERFLEATGSRTDREVAQLLDVSVPTVRRWRAGTTTPHPVMEDFAMEKLGGPPSR